MAMRISMSKSFVYIVLIIVMLAILAFIKLQHYNNVDYHDKTEREKPTIVEKAPDSALKALVVSNQNSSISLAATNTLTAADISQLTAWRESRGWFSEESLAEYANYDFETLTKLVNTGDIKAMMALSDYYMSERNPYPENNVKNAMEVLFRAAVYGSTAALDDYSTFLESEFRVSVENMTDDQKIELLAWKNVAALRGDLYPNYLAKGDMERLNFVVNETFAKKIMSRSEELYSLLQRIRTDTGLGNFDNSQSPEAEKMFSNLGNYMDQYNQK